MGSGLPKNMYTTAHASHRMLTHHLKTCSLVTLLTIFSSLCMSRLPISTMGKVPDACLLDLLHCIPTSKRSGPMPPTVVRSWLPGAKRKVGGSWKSSSVNQAGEDSASYPGDGEWSARSVGFLAIEEGARIMSERCKPAKHSSRWQWC